MTPTLPPRRLRLVAIALCGVAVFGGATVACSGSGSDSDLSSGASATSTPVVGSLVPASDPVDSAVDSGAVVSSDGPTTVPGTDTGATSTALAPPPTGQGGTVPVATIAPQAPTPIGTPAADAGGLQFAIDSIAAVDGEASGPGEIGGPALQVTVRATNTSTAPIDLSLTLIDLRHGADEVPATPFTLGTIPFAGALAPGASATGTYVFGVPVERRGQVRIYVSARPEMPAVVFEGSAR